VNHNLFSFDRLPFIPRHLLRLILGLVTVSLMTGALFPLRQGLNASTISLLYLIPVLISTTLWGLWPGVLSAFAAFLAYNYFFIRPYYTFTVHNTQDLVALLIFLVVAVIISQLIGRTRSGLAAAVARENETIHLYQLSLELAGVSSLDEVASVIARKVDETMHAAELELSIQPIYGKLAFQLSIPELRQNSGKPDQVTPLETVRAFLGEIRLWLGDRLLTLLRNACSKHLRPKALWHWNEWLAHTETQARILEESDRLNPFSFPPFRTSFARSVNHCCHNQPAE
jgi:hypothetical protein